MDTTIQELKRIKSRLESTIRSSQSELEVIDKAIGLVEREQVIPKTLLVLDTDAQPRTREFAKLKLTDAIRKAVGNDFIIPSEVRDALLLGGFPLPKAGKGRLLNYVFVTLKRLANTGEMEGGKKDGKFAVRRAPKPQLALSQGSSVALN